MKKSTLLTASFLFIGIVAGSVFSQKTPNDAKPLNIKREAIRPSNVADYLKLTATHFVEMQTPSGFYKFEYDFMAGGYTNWDNIVLQIRSMYFLLNYYNLLKKNNSNPQLAAAVLDTVRKALKGYSNATLNNNHGSFISFYYNPDNIANEAMIVSKADRQSAEVSATAWALATYLIYWNTTNSKEFLAEHKKLLKTIIYHTKEALANPNVEYNYIPECWIALATYYTIFEDKDVEELINRLNNNFQKYTNLISDVNKYSLYMMAINIEKEKKIQGNTITTVLKQTSNILDNIFPTGVQYTNTCLASIGLFNASSILDLSSNQYAKKISQLSSSRAKFEYDNSLNLFISPNQTWISLGPGRTLHTQDFLKFSGASLSGTHLPRTDISASSDCLMAGINFIK
ncbi:MAG: hypothetical protein MJ247_00475 [Alphaproteobacteria bacterium]|nr:hypothetical protein [Alphaproteobacteria bacterium]